jgi:hypothetical protein
MLPQMAVDSVPQEFILMFDSAQGVEGAKAAVRDAISHWDSQVQLRGAPPGLGSPEASESDSAADSAQGTLAPAIISTFTQDVTGTGTVTVTGPQAAADAASPGPAADSESDSEFGGIAPFHGLLVRATPHLLGVLVEHHPDLLVIEPNAIVHTSGRQALNSTGRWSNWNLDVMDQVRQE